MGLQWDSNNNWTILDYDKWISMVGGFQYQKVIDHWIDLGFLENSNIDMVNHGYNGNYKY
jgi:hypothetical protein